MFSFSFTPGRAALRELPIPADSLGGDTAIETASEGWPGEDPQASSLQATLWSVILRTRDPKDPHRIAALVRVCSQFSMALYAFVRRKGASREAAPAAVRSFFTHIRAGKLGAGSRPAPDRLRAYLLPAFENFLGRVDPHGRPTDRESARDPLSPDFTAAEAWLDTDMAKTASPETAFHRAWARCILAQSCAALEGELTVRYGDMAEPIIAEVSPLEVRPFNADLARQLNLTPSQVLEALRWARRRLREIILATLRETVSSSTDVEMEFWDLFKSV